MALLSHSIRPYSKEKPIFKTTLFPAIKLLIMALICTQPLIVAGGQHDFNTYTSCKGLETQVKKWRMTSRIAIGLLIVIAIAIIIFFLLNSHKQG